MPGWRGLAASLVLLLLTAFAAVPEAQPAGDPPAAAPPFGHEFPDATAGAALQARLGNPRLAAPDRAIEREAFETVIDNLGEAGEVRPSLEDEAAVACGRGSSLTSRSSGSLARPMPW